jgi:outer membrane immunogenic protein
MNKIIYGSAMVLGLALAGPAFAADIPLKAPQQPVYSGWGGWYVGVEVGEKWKTDDWTTNCVQGGAPGLLCGSKANAAAFPGAPDASSPHKFKNSGLRTGGYIGANTQQGLWVYGFEADWAHYDRSTSVVGLVGASTPGCCNAPPGGTGLDDRTRVTNKWDASLRLRAGYLLTPDVLLYGTGGVAFQQFSATMSCDSETSFACKVGTHAQTNRDTLPGWTVGGGLEWKLTSNLLLRGEYRFSDFGSVKNNFFLNSGDIEILSHIHVRSQIATAGIAYKFDWWR